MQHPGKKIVIVGGVAGGASAAARARRLSEDADIVMFERGEYISFANCGLPYHIDGTIKERERLLVQTPERMKQRFLIDVRTRTEVLEIDREKKQVVALNRETGEQYAEDYDYLILSPGAECILPDIPGMNTPRVKTLRNMADMDDIMSLIEEYDPERAIVIGGGYIGLEVTEALRNRDLEVTLVELANQVMAPVDPEMSSLLHQELRLFGIDLRLGTSVTEIRENGNELEFLLSNGEIVECGIGIVAIGVKPEVDLARNAGLEIGSLGGIVTDEYMRTSDPNIYAVGDAVEVKDFVLETPSLVPLAGPANRQGRIAADNIFGRKSAYKKTQGTAICKVFNLTIGMTGLNEKTLKKRTIPYEKVYVHPANHASYYPGASSISLKLLFNPEDGKILGAQAVGCKGVDKRIDVLAIAIRAGLTVYDLEEAELSYAPPYGSAKDVVNYAGFVASNVLRGDAKLGHVEDALNVDEDQVLLDVRTEPEVEAGTIPGSIHIPIDQLRDNLNELPRDKELLVFCQVGLRGYLACRILSQHGFQCRNLTGGYKTYLMATEHLLGTMEEEPEMQDDTGEAPVTVSQSNQPVIQIVKHIDARGLQCPGPVQQLRSGIDSVEVGEAIRIAATDPGFVHDIPAWCNTTGHELTEVKPENGGYVATVVKRTKPVYTVDSPSHGTQKNMSIVVFSDDFDRVMAGFLIANGAASMGYEATMFFTFWGLNVLRKDSSIKVKKNLVERMFGWKMPRGAQKLALSKMHMAGMGLAMFKGLMKKKNVSSLPELMDKAIESGVRLVACSMSMELMGIRHEELMDGVEKGGVAKYLDHAGSGNLNLFI